MYLDISELLSAFPGFRVAAVICTDIAIPEHRSPELADFVNATEKVARERWHAVELSAIPGVAAWRQAYRRFGIKKTSYRSSVERLVKNVLAGGSLPPINPFVDAYNAVSLAHVLPAGADDLDHVAGDLAFRYSRLGDSFHDMGAMDEAGFPLADPPKPGEVVYADGEKVLCRRWNWRQDARSVIRPATRRAVVTLQSMGVGEVDKAAEELVELLRRECGGRYQTALLDSKSPRAELPEVRPAD
ncbi:MAG TPA: phenylalanine--tRNA ligase beta subunit-related protein [Propylenella sp.]|nr:phenylalanine--tRNA ligase beta subunit-related protein [Propylenella sp.]